MKPDWDSLMSEYKDSKTVLVGDVDCTAGGESLCKKHDVSGYPTIKYGEPSDLKVYEGGRTMEDLKKFASEKLGPTCGPANLDLCDEADKKFIKKFQKWDIDELDMAIEEKDEKIKKVDAAASKTIAALEAKQKELGEKIESENKKKDKAIEKAKTELGYKFMKMVQTSRKPKVEAPDPDADPDFDDDAPKGADAEEKAPEPVEKAPEPTDKELESELRRQSEL